MSVSGRVTSVRPYIQVRWQESDLEKLQTPPLVIVDGKTSTVLGEETMSAGRPPLSYVAASGGMVTEMGMSNGTVTSSAVSPGSTGTSGVAKHPAGSSPTSFGAHATVGGSKVGPTSTATNTGGLTPRVKGAIASSVIVAVLFVCIAAVLFLRRYRASKDVLQQPSVEEGQQRVFELDAENTPSSSPPEKCPDKTHINTNPHSTKDNDSTTLPDAQDHSPDNKPSPSPASQPVTTLPSQTPPPPCSSGADETPSALPPPKVPTTTATGYSALPTRTASSPDPDEAALDGLRARQALLELERLRLLRLQEIEAEQERLRAQMAEFGCRSRRSSSVI
ncbi:hypothetical protein GE09DRAFT_676431 [Coniochaeta sp. 2T2.1]|nr:hypothetical protein GE09DRAFT_676431 [Coniochaeta sp. 2T2.1]